MRKILLLVAAALLVASPVSAQNKREMQMMADIRMLQEQNQQLAITLAAIADQLKAVNGRFDEQANATRKAFADQSLKVDQLSSELRVVREGVSDSNVKIGQLSQEIEAVRLSIPQCTPTSSAVPPDAAGDPAAPPPAPGTPATPVQPPPAPLPAGPGMTPQRVFETARSDYYAGQWDLCVSGFDMYLRTFPRSELASDAHLYIGECHYSDGKHEDAVAAYNQVIATYPRSASAPVAYYKRGLALERLGQVDRARESFEAVIKNFPDSDAARLAKQNLDRLNRGRPPLD